MSSSLWLDNILAYSLQIAALAVVGTGLPLVLKLRHPGVLLRYWQVLLGTCLLLPILQPWKSQTLETLPLNQLGTVKVQTTFAVSPAAPNHFSLPRVFLSVLLMGSLARLAWLAVGYCRLRLYLKNAHRFHPPPEAVVEMCRLVGVSPSIYFSNEITGPVAFGCWKSVILLPRRFHEMPHGFQKAVSCHELWHVRRNDWLFSLFEEVVLAILWFHPALWWLTNRIQLSREQVVDRLVLKTTGERKPYLDALLHMALVRGRTELTFAPLFLIKHHLTQRVALILTEVAMSRTRIAIALTLSLTLLSLTGRLAIKAFPLESPRVEAQSAALLTQAPDPGASTAASSLAITTDELSQKLVSKVNPAYPAEAKKQGVQGEVLLAVNVNAKGEVESIRIQRGHPLLVRAALDSVKQWKYAPYFKDGVAVPVNSTVFVNFALQGPARPGEQPPAPTTIRLGTSALDAKLVSRVEPVYPLEAKQKGIEGEVVFEVTIDEQGEVIDVQVLGGNAVLVGAAYDAVKYWRYTPILLNGAPVRARANVSIKFELNPKNGAAGLTPAADAPAAVINAPQAEWLRRSASRDELARRISYADLRFALGGQPGSKTDRGRIYIELGPPDQIESHPSGGLGKPYPFEIWRYWRSEQGKLLEEFLLAFHGQDYRLRLPGAATP